MKRLIIIQLGLRLFDYSGLQIQFTMFLNLLMFILITDTDFFLSRFDRRMAITSEVFVIIATFNLCIYTNFVLDLQTQYNMGLAFIATICFHLMINLYFITIELFRLFKLKLLFPKRK